MPSVNLARYGGGILLLTVMTACSSAVTPESPWSAEFAQAKATESSEFAQQILKDDAITEMEYQEAQDKHIACLDSAGIPGVQFYEDGSSTFPDQNFTTTDIDEALDSCNAEVGFSTIQRLFLSVRSNPENTDPDTLQARCLVRQGVVAEDYSGSDYNRDVTDHMRDTPETDLAEAITYSDPQNGPDAFWECAQDPMA